MKLPIERTRWHTLTHDKSLLSLGNENSNEMFIQSLTEHGVGGFEKYPDLKTAYQTLIDCVGVGRDNIILGLGSSQLLRDLFTVLDYDTIQIYEHSWELATVINRMLEKTVFTNKFTYDGAFHSKTKPEEIEGEVLYLVNPHCPTGVSFDTDTILMFAKRFRYVIVDEAYTDPLKIDSRLFQPNIIIVKTFSKLGGVPGLRLGYCVADKTIIDNLYSVKPMYEVTPSGVKYLQFITENKTIITVHEQEMKRCFNKLQETNNGFGIHCANFATFEGLGKFKGKPYTIDGKPFIRVTLTDLKNHRHLI